MAALTPSNTVSPTRLPLAVRTSSLQHNLPPKDTRWSFVTSSSTPLLPVDLLQSLHIYFHCAFHSPLTPSWPSRFPSYPHSIPIKGGGADGREMPPPPPPSSLRQPALSTTTTTTTSGRFRALPGSGPGPADGRLVLRGIPLDTSLIGVEGAETQDATGESVESGSAGTRTARRRRIRWAEDVVNNEGMGRKSSKGMVSFHTFPFDFDLPFSLFDSVCFAFLFSL